MTGATGAVKMLTNHKEEFRWEMLGERTYLRNAKISECTGDGPGWNCTPVRARVWADISKSDHAVWLQQVDEG